MTSRVARVRSLVDAVLREYRAATTNDERQDVGAEIARLCNGDARVDLADLAQRALDDTRGG